jgi:hypothetical protein
MVSLFGAAGVKESYALMGAIQPLVAMQHQIDAFKHPDKALEGRRDAIRDVALKAADVEYQRWYKEFKAGGWTEEQSKQMAAERGRDTFAKEMIAVNMKYPSLIQAFAQDRLTRKVDYEHNADLTGFHTAGKHSYKGKGKKKYHK